MRSGHLTALALSREDSAVTNQHQPTERNGGGFVGSSAELARPLVALLGVVVGGA